MKECIMCGCIIDDHDGDICECCLDDISEGYDLLPQERKDAIARADENELDKFDKEMNEEVKKRIEAIDRRYARIGI